MLPVLDFIGVGDAADWERGNTSLLYSGQRRILFDCGPSTPQAVSGPLRDPEALDAVFISHLHADHCFGLPTLMLGLRLRGRKNALTVFGGPESRSWIEPLLDLGFPDAFEPKKCFPIEFRELAEYQPFAFGSMTLTLGRNRHGVPCHAVRCEEGGSSMLLCPDGRPTEPCLELYDDTDLLVQECEWLTPRREDHADLQWLGDHLATARIRHIALVHIDPGSRPALAQRLPEALHCHAWVPESGSRYGWEEAAVGVESLP